MKSKGILLVYIFSMCSLYLKEAFAFFGGKENVLLPYEEGAPDPGHTHFAHHHHTSHHVEEPGSYMAQKEIIPMSTTATGTEEYSSGRKEVCINGVCSTDGIPGVGPDGVPLGPMPGDPFPPIMREKYKDSHPTEIGAEHGMGFDSMHTSGVSGAGHMGGHPFVGGHLGSMPASRSAAPLLSSLYGPATGYGTGPTKDEALGIIFSIDDEDSYLVLSNLSMDMPMKTLLSNVTMTSDEVYAQDRKEYLMSELEGKGSIFGFDNGLNVLYSSKMFFYIPRTAISLTIQVGRVIYSQDFISFIRRLGLKTSVFIKTRDRDGSTIYYITIFGGTIALPNPHTPIVSQYMSTPEGYGLSLLKVKRVEIDKGVLILNNMGYYEEDTIEVASVIQKYTSGEIENPFSYNAQKYGFEDESLLSDESYDNSSYSSSASRSSSSRSSSRESYSREDSRYADEDSDASSESSESSESLSSRSSSESRSSQSNSSSKMANDEEDQKKRKNAGKLGGIKKKIKDAIKALLAKARKYREKAAIASAKSKNKKYRKHALKKAKEAVKKAMKLQNELRNSEILEARKSGMSVTSEGIDMEAVSSQASLGSVVEGENTTAGSSWYSSSMSSNSAVKAIIETKSESSSSYTSAFEESSKKTFSSSFSSNAASSIISAHQSNEMYYKGVSSSEYATREIRHSLMSMTMQHALFSSSGHMSTSQEYSSYGVKSSKSSSKWLSKRISSIITSRRAESRASRKFMSHGATSMSVARAASKEQAARSAAIKASRKASHSHSMEMSYKSKAKMAESQKNKRLAKSYMSKAAKHKANFARHSAMAGRFSQALDLFKKSKLEECKKQAAILAQRMSAPSKYISKQDVVQLNKAVAQILSSSQIQVLSKVLSSAQIRVLTSMLTPQQVQQTLVHIGAMTPSQMQGLLVKLQMKGAELERLPVALPGMMDPMSNIGSAYPLGMPAIGRIMTQVQGVPAQVKGSDIIKYLTQSQGVLQLQSAQINAQQINLLQQEAIKQSQLIQKIIMQVQAGKHEIESAVRDKMFGDKMKSSVSVCNPMLGAQTGMSTDVFDGITSQAGLDMAGSVSLNKNSFNAIRQLLVSPSVASYIGIEPNSLSNVLYEKTKNDELMALLCKSSIAAPYYNRMPSDEQALINAKFDSTQNKLFGIYGNSLGRLEQALASAFNLIRTSSVKCDKKNQQQVIPTCQIRSMISN